MVEAALYNKTIDFYSGIIDSVDDVVVAILKALQKKADKNAEKVIEDFLKYVENGGRLKSVEINKDALDVLSSHLKDKDISYLSTTNAEDDSLMVVHFKDNDAEKVQEILDDLTDQGVKLQYTNRVDIKDFTTSRGGQIAQAVFTASEFKASRKEISHILNRELNIPYTTHQSVDGNTIVISVPSDFSDELNKTKAFEGRVRRLDEKLSLAEIKKEIEKHKQEEPKPDKENSKTKTHGL